MADKKFFVGQRLLRVDSRLRDEMRWVTVTKVGRKYVHASAEWRDFLVNKETGKDRDSWSAIYSTPKELEQRINAERMRKALDKSMRNLRDWTERFSEEELREILAKLGGEPPEPFFAPKDPQDMALPQEELA